MKTNLIELKVTVDVSDKDQFNAMQSLLSTLGGVPFIATQEVAIVLKNEEVINDKAKEKVAENVVKSEDQPTAPAYTLTEVREAVAAKAIEHKNEIKEKLTEMGAANVKKLEPSQYEELMDFLKKL